MTRRAALLDRDGTVMVDFHFTDQPVDVVLLGGAARAVRRLNQADVPVIIITNQSGIARGFFTREETDRVHARLQQELRRWGAHVDDFYVCPHHPDFTGPCACRKPGTLLFERAAADHDLDLASCLYAGDHFRDIEPGLTLGGLAILVPTDETPPADLDAARARASITSSLNEAVDRFLGSGA
ncbi:MAG TPA: HAD-IIIA family hydrolase [Gemmatimonadaceae bacterium]|nr:HAD-IIIA family hydrolase [Gemmatimonadaceae bacterium]